MTGRQHQQRFETLLREHQKIVFKIAAVYAHNTADREDLTQEIAAQLWRSFAGYNERRARFSTWMYRVALNVAISHLRREQRADAGRFETMDEQHLQTIGDESATQHDAVEQNQRIAALHAFIARLDPLNRALILLYLEDKSYVEIAAVLGISETNVATKIGRIKQKLRTQMVDSHTINTGA